MPAGAYTTLERPRRPIEEMNARRAAANRVEDMVRYNTESWISTERARWERKTHATIKKRERTTRIRAMDAKAADGLRERRMRLATLLREEAEGWRKEVASRPSGDLVHVRTDTYFKRTSPRRCKGSRAENDARAAGKTERRPQANFGETPEVRKAKLENKALELGRRREAARKKTVDECYARQRRLACDDVRSRDSEAFVRAVTKLHGAASFVRSVGQACP